MLANLENDKWFLKQVKLGRLTVLPTGRIRNTKTGRVLRTKDSQGYNKIFLRDLTTDKIRCIQGHRLVWVYVNGLITDADMVINHKNGLKWDNKISNLELVTVTENNAHAWKTGLCSGAKGEKNSNSLFTNAQVRYLRRKFANYKGKKTYKDFAEILSVHPVTLEWILTGKSYQYIHTGYEDKCEEKIRVCKKITKTSDALRDEIHRLHELGKSSYYIAKMLSVSRNTVMKYW